MDLSGQDRERGYRELMVKHESQNSPFPGENLEDNLECRRAHFEKIQPLVIKIKIQITYISMYIKHQN